jgi:PAS domain S-box-containing protein
MMKFTSLTQRFMVWFVVITVLPILLIGYSLLHTFEEELQQTMLAQVAAIADKKIEQIDSFLDERINDAWVKTQSNTVQQVMGAFAQSFARDGVKSAAYQRLDARYRGYFQRFVSSAGYYDLFLISTRGDVVYSQTHESDFATNVFNGPYRLSGLSRVARSALQTLEGSISEFELYAPSGKAVAAFIAAPIVINGNVAGVLAMQIDKTKLFAVLLDNTGLGETGETVVARLQDEHTALSLTPLKANADAALKYKIPLNDGQRATSLRRALQGERGSGIAYDYDGKSVLAAWRYLPILRAGIVSKIDTAEALAPYYRVRNFSIGMLVFALVAALFAAFLFGRSLIDRLTSIKNGAQNFADGMLGQRIPVNRQDELGRLAQSFNMMAERLQSFYHDLEGRVNQRTAELKLAMESMLIKDAAIANSINAIALADLEGKINYVNQAFIDLWRLSGPADAIGRSPVEFWENPEAAQTVIAALQSRGYWRGELIARLHDGALAELELSANMVRGSAGEPLCMMASFVNVTARNFAEQELQKSETLLDTLIDDMPAMVFVKRASDLRYEKFNHAGEALLGFSEAELLGKNDYDFFPREQADFFTEKDRAVLASRKLIDIVQEPILTRSGETRILHTRKIGIYNAAGEPTHLLGVSIDITAQTQMEETLRLGSERMIEAQRIAKMGNWELDLQSGKLTWSDEIFKLFEIDKSKFGATYEAFLNGIHPDDRDMVNHAYTESLKNRKPYQITHRLQMSGGQIKWVEERCETDFDSGGKPLISRGTVQDITRQKIAEDLLRDSETRYHSVVAALAEGVVLNARDGSISAANKAAEEILGLSIEQMMGKTPLDPSWRAIHEDGTPFPGEEHPGSVTLRTGRPMSNVIMGVHKPDGRLTWISINSQPIFQPGETLPSTVVASFIDITERKNAEDLLRNTNDELERRVELRTKLLREAKEEAEKANASKSLFLTSMSHELRTPLNAILGYAQLMQLDKDLPQAIVENAGEIRRAGDYLLNLMNDILDLARIESGRLDLQLEMVSLFDVMGSCYAYNVQAAKARNVTLHLEESCSAYSVIADLRALTQVLNNLISNAIKYNRDGGRVSVSCAPVPPAVKGGSGTIRISVADSGVGIAADKMPKLFQSFNRLGAELGNIEGTGIGLVIARKLIEGMQGEIGVESVYGSGSTFWIELPLEKKAGAHALELLAKPPRVLVAEDYVPNQNVLQLQLQTMGCEVEVAPDGAAALNMWRKNSYDLILTDIDMPVMNGTELALAIRNEERNRGESHIPIIAITATNSKSELKRYQSAGIDEVLNKPLSMDALRKGLVQWFVNIKASPKKYSAVKATPAVNVEDNAILDLNYLYQILGQVNLVQARILLDTFMRTADEGLDALSALMDNPVLVAKEMHKQKSSARTVGALRYANLAATLEQHTKDNQFSGVASALAALREALAEVETASANLLETPRERTIIEPVGTAAIAKVACRSALVVDDDLVVLQQVKAMLDALGVKQVITAINGVEASKIMAARGGEIEVLVCDLSMPEMDGVELIRRFGKTGFKGGLILISGAEEKIISTVNNLAVLQGLRVLGQLQKPVSAAQLAILLARTTDLPAQERQAASGPLVSREAICAAMEANEFSIWFQPKVNASTLRVVGMEALARWQLPNGKFIPPDSFITVAEREGVIADLSQLLVSLALTEAAKLFAAGFPLKVAVNLSGTWLNDLTLPDFILSKTNAAGLRAADVILEVTETGVMEDLTTALDVLSRLRLKGFGLSIDDFGIGYSSFEQLGRIPFTEMKLDRSFVSKGVQDAAARAILESSMDMAHKLNLSTVAEGVETELDLKLVRSLGCDLLQGYLIAKPMPVKDLLVWLANEKSKKK